MIKPVAREGQTLRPAIDRHAFPRAIGRHAGQGRAVEFEVQKAFAPRLGVAYQYNEKTVIRAGYGRSFDVGVFGSLFGHAVTQNLPVLSAQYLSTSGFNRVFTLAAGPPAPPFIDPPTNGKIKLPNGVFARSRPFEQTLPTVDAWNVTVQYKLKQNTSAEFAYVGNKGTHVFSGFQGSTPAFNVNQSINDLSQPDADKRKPFFSKFGWMQGIDFFCNCNDNRYNAFQAKFETRVADLNILAHYTLAHATTEDGDYIIYDSKLNQGTAVDDRKHVFFLSEVWDLPFGKGKKHFGGVSKAADLFIGCWQVNTVTSVSSGLPFTPSVSGANCSVNAGPCRPDVTGDTDGNKDRNNWFKVGIGTGTPWAKAATGRFGNAGRNSLRGPGFFNTDASLFKKFHLTEGIKLEFRAEAFNLFNHVNLNNPDNCVDCGSNAGKINGLAPGSTMRQFQFGLRLNF